MGRTRFCEGEFDKICKTASDCRKQIQGLRNLKIPESLNPVISSNGNAVLA